MVAFGPCLKAQDTLLFRGNSQVPDSLPDHYLTQIDSLLQAKARLLQARITNLHTKATGKLQGLDSISSISGDNFFNDKLKGLNPQEYTAKMSDINESLQAYKSKITDSEELAWIEHYSGQLDQLEGVVKQYQNKLLNLEELQAFKGYGPQLQQLSQESRGYFKEIGRASCRERV